MFRCILLLLSFLMLSFGVSTARTVESCINFQRNAFGPDSIDNANFCAGACKADGMELGSFKELADNEFRCDCMNKDRTTSYTLCQGSQNNSASINANEASPDFVRVYESPSVAETMAESPRFGHTRDISVLFADSEAQSEYYRGLIAASIMMAVFFFVFIVIILVFMCCGKRRVGFLSGAPFERTRSSDKYGAHQEQPRSSTTKTTGCCGVDRSTWVRLTYIIFGTIFIICSFLMVSEGITNLQETVGTVHQSSTDIRLLALEAKDIITKGITGLENIANNVQGSLAEELTAENFCPDDPNLENNQKGKEIRDQINEALELFTKVESVSDDIDGVSDAIDEAVEGAEDIEAKTENVNLEKTVGLVILIVFSIIPCLLVSAAIMAQFDVKACPFVCVINWFFLPVFILMVLFCIIVACAMVATASANSDFCLPGGYPEKDVYPAGSPDTTIKRILDQTGVEKTDFVRELTVYYVEQCQNVEDPYSFLTVLRPDLNVGRDALSRLKERIQDEGVMKDLSDTCGREYDVLEALLIEMANIFEVLAEAIDRTLDLVSCERIVPIYHQVVYDGTCQYSVSACVWIFATALVMGIFGLFMILFRSAYKPTIYKEDPKEVW